MAKKPIFFIKNFDQIFKILAHSGPICFLLEMFAKYKLPKYTMDQYTEKDVKIINFHIWC
jgi:hypothetical protein